MVEKKYIEIAAVIRADIENGKYPLGTNIPSIRALAVRYKANPQTINKATAYLASLGYLAARAGAGSTVCKPFVKPDRPRLPMLIDNFRARLLNDLNDVANYHGKDIYLSYLMMTAHRGESSSFIVYDRDESETPSGFDEDLAGVEGVIVQGSLPAGRIATLARLNIPTVIINRRCPQLDSGRFASVLIPNDHLADLVNLLASLGHQGMFFALSDRFAHSTVFDDRLATVRHACASRGMAEDAVETFVYTENSPRDAERLADTVAAGRSAVVAYNDVSALGLYGLSSMAGLSLPKDLSIVGFDDIAMSQLSSPSLTTIRVDRRELVAQAFGLMDRLVAGGMPMRLEASVRTELVIRQSAFRHD